MFNFTQKLINRTTFPARHVLLAEDNLGWQSLVTSRIGQLFGVDGLVQVTVCPGGAFAAMCLQCSQEIQPVNLLMVDHDMPFGQGDELVRWCRQPGGAFQDLPIISLSGIDHNNTNLMTAGASHRSSKSEFAAGEADGLLKQILDVA